MIRTEKPTYLQEKTVVQTKTIVCRFHNTENGGMELILEIKGEEERGNWVEIDNEDCSDLHGIWDIKCGIM